MADGYWICSKCSWVNKAQEASAGCKACGKAAPPGTLAPPAPPARIYHPIPSAPPDLSPYRPVSHVPAQQQHQQQEQEQVPDDLWLCSKCSWVNQTLHSECRACGHLAPPGTKLTAPPPPVVYHPPPPPVVYHPPPPAAYRPPPPAAYRPPPQAVPVTRPPPEWAPPPPAESKPTISLTPPQQQQQQQHPPAPDDFVSGFASHPRYERRR